MKAKYEAEMAKIKVRMLLLLLWRRFAEGGRLTFFFASFRRKV